MMQRSTEGKKKKEKKIEILLLPLFWIQEIKLLYSSQCSSDHFGLKLQR